MLPIDDLDEQLLGLAQKLPQEFYIVLMLGWVNSRYVATNFGDKVRQQMFLQSDVLSKVNANQAFITYFFNAWMHSAYAEGNNRLQLKRNINKMIVNFLKQDDFFKNNSPEKPQRDKPLMLVIHEHVAKGHAMFRSYVPYFKHLADKFHLVSLADTDLPSMLRDDIFSKHLKVEDVADLRQIIDMVHELRPDIIYYPSLGMKHWTLFLSNIRLAPMQVMSCGHPDSSQSQVIDYLYYGPDVPFIRAECSEKIICLKDYKFKSWPHEELEGRQLSISPTEDGRIHIAVNSTLMKLTPRFIDCLEQLQQEFGDKILFHFFHGMLGFLALQTEVVIKRRLPSAFVYSAKHYGAFLQLLKTCHLSLSPFPFGNTNSIFDATIVGLPVVALKQTRIAGYTDFLVLQAFGLEQLGMAENIDQYMDKARTLIKDPEVYARHRDAVRLAVDIYLKQSKSEQYDASFAEAMYATYQIHQKGSHKWTFCWDGEKLIAR
jgi:predicted O-linked N-acetylglucosamine transferase (SPINDLY family)